jgi:hypothetical protein
MSETLAIPDLSDVPDAATTATTLSGLRDAGVLGDTYADLSLVLTLQDEDADFDTFEAIGRFLARALDACRFWLADWLIFGEGAFGDRFYQAADVTGLSETTLVDYARVAMRVPRSRRRDNLHFSHHREVAKLDPEAQTYWLDLAVERGYSTRELRDAIQAAREEAQPRLEEPGEHPDVDLVRVDRSLLAAIVREAAEDDDPRYRKVPEELIVRLAASIGEGE